MAVALGTSGPQHSTTTVMELARVDSRMLDHMSRCDWTTMY